MVCDYCIEKCKKFSPSTSLLIAIWAIFFAIQNIYVNPKSVHSQNSITAAETNDPEDHPNQHKNSLKISDELSIVLSFLESRWKLRQQHNQNFPTERKPLQNKYWHQKKEINPTDQDC